MLGYPAAIVPDADGLGLSAVAVDSREVFDISERMSSGMKPPLGACRAHQRLFLEPPWRGRVPIVPHTSASVCRSRVRSLAQCVLRAVATARKKAAASTGAVSGTY